MTPTSVSPLKMERLNCTSSGCRNSRSLLLLFSLLIPAGLLLSGCGKGAAAKPAAARDDAIPVQVTKVVLEELDRTIPVVGTLAARSEALVAAQVDGQVEQTLVDFGNRVERGQEMVLIDTASYAAVARQAAANLSKARANALNGEQSLHRIQQLITDKISSASELDSAVAAAQQGAAEVESAQAAEAIAQLNLARSRVKAPFDASVSERIVTAGDYVKVASPLYRIVDDTELKYLIQASESYASKVKLGQLVQFTVDAWPGETFQGSVFLISPSVNTTTRAFNLGALVSNKEKKLKANMFARGELILEKNVPTPMVPLESVINFAGVTKVFTISEKVARSREVKLGRVLNGKQEILAGLTAGELVVTSGQTKLYEGAKIRLQETPSTQPAAGSSSATPAASSTSRASARFFSPAVQRCGELMWPVQPGQFPA
jgi:membrane fusion protein, multidrug efflux system